MLTIGNSFPEFDLKAVLAGSSTPIMTDINHLSYANKWRVFFFWPKDFTFVCPTELMEFGKLNQEFANRGAVLLGASTDSEYVHSAWREFNPLISQLPFPMLADIKRELSTQLGIIDETEGVAQRATFIVDPDNTIRFVMVTDLNVGRNANEVLRILDALQTKELCPCNWQPGENTLTVKATT